MTKSEFTMSINEAINMVLITDLNTGGMSVTNDIENVVKEVQKSLEPGQNLSDYRVVSLNSFGLYDQILVKDGEFLDFGNKLDQPSWKDCLD